jgi:hypothetical protein
MKALARKALFFSRKPTLTVRKTSLGLTRMYFDKQIDFGSHKPIFNGITSCCSESSKYELGLIFLNGITAWTDLGHNGGGDE